MEASGHPRAQSIAAALSNADRHPRKADGGGIAPGLQPSTATQNPVARGYIQQIENIPTEKLQELASGQMGTSPQGSMIREVLAQRHLMPPATTSSMPPVGPPGSQPPAFADGGGLDWEQSEKMAAHLSHAPTTGFLHSAVPGRTDLIHAQPPVGSYVVPADVVSGIGEGNSLAGAAMLQHALSSGPYGTPLPSGHASPRLPSPPRPFTEPMMGPAAKRGGATQGDRDVGKPTPILAAGGEFVVPPDVVKAWGGGNLKKGHDLLDAWVVAKRKQVAGEMQKLPGPKKG